MPVYEMLSKELITIGANFRAIGASLEPIHADGFENIPWSESEEISLINSLDIGIMPLHDDPWTRGKCGYKLIQYMACGIPVVASPIGVNTSIVHHGVNGFLASTEEEWSESINRLVSNPRLRKQMGEAGRQIVEERFSLQAWAPRVAEIVSSIARCRSASAVA